MKKLLLLLLISLNTYADVGVVVTLKDGRKACGGRCDFKNQFEADIWKADNISNDSWGVSGDYTIGESDITDEVQAEADAKEARRIDIQQVKAMLSDINSSSLPPWHKQLLRRLARELKE